MSDLCRRSYIGICREVSLRVICAPAVILFMSAEEVSV